MTAVQFLNSSKLLRFTRLYHSNRLRDHTYRYPLQFQYSPLLDLYQDPARLPVDYIIFYHAFAYLGFRALHQAAKLTINPLTHSVETHKETRYPQRNYGELKPVVLVRLVLAPAPPNPGEPATKVSIGAWLRA